MQKILLLFFYAKKNPGFLRVAHFLIAPCCHLFLDEGAPDNQAMDEEKKQREHLLALNQVIARQVMEKSRMVAGKNTANHQILCSLQKLRILKFCYLL